MYYGIGANHDYSSWLARRGSSAARTGCGASWLACGAEFGGKTFFATGWGDSGCGLAVFDPRTCVLTSFHQADGLDTDKLASVAADQDRLRLTFDVEYLRHNSQGEPRLFVRPAVRYGQRDANDLRAHRRPARGISLRRAARAR